MGRIPDLTSEDGTFSCTPGERGALIKPLPPPPAPSFLLCKTTRLLLFQRHRLLCGASHGPWHSDANSDLKPPAPPQPSPLARPAPGHINKSMNPRSLLGGWLIESGSRICRVIINAPRVSVGSSPSCKSEFKAWLFNLLLLKEQSGLCGSDTVCQPLTSEPAQPGTHSSQPPKKRVSWPRFKNREAEAVKGEVPA